MPTNKWPLRLIWILTLVPVLLAWSLAYFGNNTDFHTKNHGELAPAGITVPQPLITELDGRWGLMVLSHDCNQHCQTQLFRLRQLHTAMGRDLTRLHALWLTDEAGLGSLETKNLAQIEIVDNPSLLQWFNQQAVVWQDQAIWLVDPNGVLVMRFDPTLEGRAILSDLHWLLTASRIG